MITLILFGASIMWCFFSLAKTAASQHEDNFHNRIGKYD